MSENMSLSKHLDLNGKNAVQVDEYGNPCEGTRIGEDGTTIYRFHKGLLDGNVYDKDGKVIQEKPAIEKKGHIEYWKEGKLHRADGLPAIMGNGFTEKEWWIDGHRQPSPEHKVDVVAERDKGL